MLIPGLKLSVDDIYANGYVFSDHRSYARGYVSRKQEIFEIKEAGGRRKGQYYIDMPSFESSRYHIRQYLLKKEV